MKKIEIMNDAHLHLVLNHLPIILPLIGLLIMIGGLLFRSEIIKRTAYLIFILAAVVTIPTFAAGEGAEQVIEKLSGVDEYLIKTHKEIAETFAIVCYVLGGISLLGLWANFYKKSLSKIICFTVIGICVITLFFAIKTATSGGEIRHPEIRTVSAIKNIELK